MFREGTLCKLCLKKLVRTTQIVRFKTHYIALGVSQTATQKEIRDAYIKLSKQLHPDQNRQDSQESHDNFVKINEAYEVLGKHASRRQYDETLKYQYRQPSPNLSNYPNTGHYQTSHMHRDGFHHGGYGARSSYDPFTTNNFDANYYERQKVDMDLRASFRRHMKNLNKEYEPLFFTEKFTKKVKLIVTVVAIISPYIILLFLTPTLNVTGQGQKKTCWGYSKPRPRRREKPMTKEQRLAYKEKLKKQETSALLIVGAVIFTIISIQVIRDRNDYLVRKYEADQKSKKLKQIHDSGHSDGS